MSDHDILSDFDRLYRLAIERGWKIGIAHVEPHGRRQLQGSEYEAALARRQIVIDTGERIYRCTEPSAGGRNLNELAATAREELHC